MLLCFLSFPGLAQRLYYVDDGVLRVCNLDGTGLTGVGVGGQSMVAADPYNGYLFYGNTLEFYRANLDGTSPVQLTDFGAFAGYNSMDTDPNNESLVYVGISDDMDDIWRGSYYDTPSDNQVNITPSGIPTEEFTDICFNRATENVYVSGYNDGSIYESDIMGSSYRLITSDNAYGPIAVDHINNQLYWVRQVGASYHLMMTDILTLSASLVVDNSDTPITSIDVYPEINTVFFSEFFSIKTCSLDGSLLNEIIPSGGGITDIAIAEDVTYPFITTLSPADNAATVTAGSDLVLTFNENVAIATAAGTANETSIRIYESAGPTLIQTIPRGDASISISGNTVTISGINTSSFSTAYHVQVGSKVFTDHYNNSYGGIAGTTGWNFTTDINTSKYYSRADGDWDDPNTWSHTGHSGPPVPNTPGTGSDITIGNGNTVTLSGNVGAIAADDGLLIEPGATLDMNGYNLTVWGDIRIEGTLLNGGTLSGIWNLYATGLPVFDRIEYDGMLSTPSELFTNVVALNGLVAVNGGVLNTNGFEVCVPPTPIPVSPVFSNVYANSVTLSWTAGGGSTLIVAREGSTDVQPKFGIAYTPNTTFGSGSTTGAGNFVVYNGTGNTVTISGLTPSTDYEFDLYASNTSIGGCYAVHNYQFAAVTSCVVVDPPTDPVGAAYCSGETKPAISVASPGSGKNINWYDAAVGGNLVTGDLSGGDGRGEVFVPTAASGTFYAETYDGTSSCASSTRTAVTLTMNPALVTGTPSINQNICTSGDPASISGGTPSGGTGTFTYQWESATASGGPYTPIASATGSNYDPPGGLATTTYYRRIVYSGGCEQAGNEVTVNVIAPPVIVTHPQGEEVCAGTPVSFSVATTGTALTYRWQVDGGSGFSDINNGGVYSGATTATLQIADGDGLNNFRYQCIVTASALCATNSNPSLLNVNAIPSATSQPLAACETVAGSSTAVVNLASLNNAISGGAGSVSVSWFANAARTTPVPTPSSTTAANGAIYYAVVTNTITNCANITAQATVTVNA
ncbi:MAG TPA: Ig-like domain-containing protein, partial [Ohtaekwangia sp.]|nr:Ig-like domain-containing protein [Ohtaekwangia sp.]